MHGTHVHTDACTIRKRPPEITLTWSCFQFMEIHFHGHQGARGTVPWLASYFQVLSILLCPSQGGTELPSLRVPAARPTSRSGAASCHSEPCTNPSASLSLSVLICKMKGGPGESLRPSAALASGPQGLLGSQVEAISQITEPHLATVVRGPPLGIGRLEILPSTFVNIWLKHSPNPNLILSIWGEN